jgi:hypothetical protein
MVTDVRHAMRALLRAPGFTTTAVLTLAIGIGGTAAMFTVVNRMVLHPLARRYWPGESPLGRRIALDLETMRFYLDRPPTSDIKGGMREIVGIVRDIRHGSLHASAVPEM